MIFHENRQPADDSHEISYFIFFRTIRKMSQKLSSTAVGIGALSVRETDKIRSQGWHVFYPEMRVGLTSCLFSV